MDRVAYRLAGIDGAPVETEYVSAQVDSTVFL